MTYNKAYQGSLTRKSSKDSLDFWRTPPQATQALFDKETFSGMIIHEPACGLGDMSEVILKNIDNKTQSLLSTDIENRGYTGQNSTHDFLEMNMHSSSIITNPPFILAEEFIRKALSCTSEKVAMLLKLEFLQSQKRTSLFESTPLKTVYIFEYRIPFWQEGYPTPINNQRHAWYVWEHGYTGSPTLDWIKIPEGGLDRRWWNKL